MVAVILGTHGNFSEELLNSSEMIFGKQENVGYITFKPGEGLEDLVDKYNEVISELDTKDGVLFMVDLFGGSPYNVASMMALKNDNMEVVAGVNLPMVLEIFGSMKFLNLKELVSVALTAGNKSIKSLIKVIKNTEEDDL
ncbi:mannose/fructose/sorbose PTS transporter subunit IIA [Clostridium sp. Ade.TY]|uniref:PTS sugar transporter subunit IIA n=1 Tax=Clostridium sp. Ade.TY TaxID=1391647 RepID=UPI00046648D5|nr:mannose/fructose/sorbose PTS transporter subunit IIA [Clostridium sp. Ade.TY]